MMTSEPIGDDMEGVEPIEASEAGGPVENEIEANEPEASEPKASEPEISEPNPELKGSEGLMLEVAIRLECCSCQGIAPPPIRQCGNGHVICLDCLNNLQKNSTTPKCPSCFVPVKNAARNLVLEEVGASVVVPCKHANCGKQVKHADLAKHIHTHSSSFKDFLVPAWKGGKEGEEKKEPSASAQGSLLQRIQKYLECRFCNEIAPAPLQQCRNGHIICAVCLGRLLKADNSMCPFCSIAIQEPAPRNLHLEEMASSYSVSVSCRNPDCEKQVDYDDLAEHIESCEHQPVKCESCKGEATLPNWDAMWEHYQEKHLSRFTETLLSNLVVKQSSLLKMFNGKLKYISWGHCLDPDGATARIFPVLYHCKTRKVFFFSIRIMGALSSDLYHLRVSSANSSLSAEAWVPAMSYRVPCTKTLRKPCLAVSAETMKAMTGNAKNGILLQVSLPENN